MSAAKIWLDGEGEQHEGPERRSRYLRELSMEDNVSDNNTLR